MDLTTRILSIKSKLEKDDKIIFTYTGGFYGGQTPFYFVQAIKKLWQENNLPDNIRFLFVGNFVNNIQAIFSEVASIIEVIPQVSHKESIRYMKSSDVLLLFVAKENSDMVIPAKIFLNTLQQKSRF